MVILHKHLLRLHNNFLQLKLNLKPQRQVVYSMYLQRQNYLMLRLVLQDFQNKQQWKMRLMLVLMVFLKFRIELMD